MPVSADYLSRESRKEKTYLCIILFATKRICPKAWMLGCCNLLSWDNSAGFPGLMYLNFALCCKFYLVLAYSLWISAKASALCLRFAFGLLIMHHIV